MPVSRFQPRLDINGVIDTSKSVLDNMNQIADNSAIFLTYDNTQGKWSAILNRRETGVYETAPLFDDTNIVGSINVSRSDLTGIANSARISYPSNDLRGDTDEVYIYIPEADFYPNETRNELSLSYDLINNSVQAAIVGRIDLKQGRSDRVVVFKTDYTALGVLKAGQLFLLSNTPYGYTTKIFRAITIEEIEGDDGELLIQITALEYDDNVYGESGIVREERNKKTGLKPATINECIIEKENAEISNKVGESLSTDQGIANLTQDIELAPGYIVGLTLFQTEQVGFSVAQTTNIFGGGQSGGGSGDIYWEAYRPIKNQLLTFEGPQGTVNYTVDGSSKSILAGVPARVILYQGPPGQAGPWTYVTERYMEWSSYITSINISTTEPKSFRLQLLPLNTYDLDAASNYVTIDSVSSIFPNAQGDGCTLTVMAFLN